MNINANVLPRSGLMGSTEAAVPRPESVTPAKNRDWTPEIFAREQVRGLVRRLFFTNSGRTVKQVVFCAADAKTSVGNLCDLVGQAIADETTAEIAVVSRDSENERTRATERDSGYGETAGVKVWSKRIAGHLWGVRESSLRARFPERTPGRFWLWALAVLQNEFEYVVIEGPAAGISSESALLGQLTDGIILVIEARNTRKATARKIKETLEGSQSRILGTVLSERKFPVPEGLYRRL